MKKKLTKTQEKILDRIEFLKQLDSDLAYGFIYQEEHKEKMQEINEEIDEIENRLYNRAIKKAIKEIMP